MSLDERAAGGGAKVRIEAFSFFYPGGHAALRDITLAIASNRILGIIGPSSSGKTTLLRCLNRLTDLVHGTRHDGRILLDGEDIYGPKVEPADLRRRVGMVFATPVPLPRSIYDNIAYGPRLPGVRERARLDELVESSLKAAFLWDEVKDRLDSSALRLSGGQQQRLCLARTLALEPEVILLDEPCSGLDPISTLKIEEALSELKERYTIVLVTNNTKQAARVSDETAFFLMGELVEHGRRAADLHRAAGPAHQRLHHREVRVGHGRRGQDRRAVAQPLLRGVPRAEGREPHHPGAPDHGHHRPLRLRQDHAAPALNRMNDLVENARVEGTVLLDGEDIYRPSRAWRCCASAWAWSSSGRTPSRSRSTTTWPTARGCTGRPGATCSRRRSRRACAR